MKTIVLAVGRLRPPYADDVQHYRTPLARHAKVEFVEVREDCDRGIFALVEMVLFILTVFIAYAYVWRRGGLEWD